MNLLRQVASESGAKTLCFCFCVEVSSGSASLVLCFSTLEVSFLATLHWGLQF